MEERDERGRERDTGWGRDRLRDHAVVRSRESLGEDSRQVYPGNNGRDKQKYATMTNILIV